LTNQLVLELFLDGVDYMPDVTGRVYEAFTEFILRRIGYRDEWTAGSGRQYLYEKHPEATCHTSSAICPYAEQCDSFSKQHQIPFGPWYDPDFFILDNETPIASIQVTHWSDQRSSKKKFWRMVEDHFQYKTFFGRNFLSINLVFVALDEESTPLLLTGTIDKLHLHGWDPAIGSVLVSAFDASIIFPKQYRPLEVFASHMPKGNHGGSRQRRELYNGILADLYKTNSFVRQEINQVIELFKRAFSTSPHPRYSPVSIGHLQEVCFNGRLRSVDISPTASKYRKGLLHAFIVREMIARYWGADTDPDEALWRVLRTNPRFPWGKFASILGLPPTIPEPKVQDFGSLLASIPIQVVKRVPQPLFIEHSGIDHATWNNDFAQFILGLRYLNSSDLSAFQQAVKELFASFSRAYGMDYVLADLHEPERIKQKANYVTRYYIGITDKDQFIAKFASDMLTPGTFPRHQSVVEDIHNWVLDVILTFYNLGSIQEIDNRIFSLYQQYYGESLRLYAYQANYLVGYLLAGVDIAPHINRKAQFSRDEFYMKIWPLVAECVWEAKQNIPPLDLEEVIAIYRFKKARRIIASSDLEPISFLFRRNLANLTDGSILRGVFNQLSTLRKWSRSALTTKPSGKDPKTGAIIQTQSVFGRKHIADKTREIAGRLRAVHLRCNSDGSFSPEPNPGIHYLVIDGDWPIESKINLYEAGFSGIYEIAELHHLSNELNPDKGTV
jgi:hypothetical protein